METRFIKLRIGGSSACEFIRFLELTMVRFGNPEPASTTCARLTLSPQDYELVYIWHQCVYVSSLSTVLATLQAGDRHSCRLFSSL